MQQATGGGVRGSRHRLHSLIPGYIAFLFGAILLKKGAGYLMQPGCTRLPAGLPAENKFRKLDKCPVYSYTYK